MGIELPNKKNCMNDNISGKQCQYDVIVWGASGFTGRLVTE